MFAPYCSTCRQRVLLGPRRIASGSWHAADRPLLLRCFCGTVVAADGVPPTPEVGQVDAPVAASAG